MTDTLETLKRLIPPDSFFEASEDLKKVYIPTEALKAIKDAIGELEQVAEQQAEVERLRKVCQLAIGDSRAVFERLKYNKPDDHIYHQLYENCVKAEQALGEKNE